MTTALELHDRWVGASSKARRLELLLTRCLTDEFGITSKALRTDIESELDSRECPRCYKPLVNGHGGCKGSQHGNNGCAMNNPSYTRYEGRCNHCGTRGAFLRAGIHACIWGGCNGTVNAVATHVVGAP